MLHEFELEQEYEAFLPEYEIIGLDQRVRVTNTLATPFRYICNLELNGQAMCTGTLIGPNTVLTAGHCLEGVNPAQLRVIPARNGLSEPLPASGAAAIRLAPGFAATTRTDFGVIYLRNPIGYRLGYWTLGYNRFNRDPVGTSISADPMPMRGGRMQVQVSGYPADKPNPGFGCVDPTQPQNRCRHSRLSDPRRQRVCGTQQFRAADRLVSSQNGILEYLDDTCPGHSGSPVWVNRRASLGGRTLIGIHVSGDNPATPTVANRAVRITPAVLTQIQRWLAAAPVSPRPAKPTLRIGSRGAAVTELQNRINRWLASAPWIGVAALKRDGIFGPKTRAAVIALQRAMSLGVDGVVGPQTWTRLLTLP